MNQKINIIDYNFVPETLEWCRKHYVPSIKEHISCKDFGDCDGMDGRRLGNNMSNINYHRYCDSIALTGYDKKTFLNKWYRRGVEWFNKHYEKEWDNYHSFTQAYYEVQEAKGRDGIDIVANKEYKFIEKHYNPFKCHKFIWALVKIPRNIESWLCCGWKLHYNKEYHCWEYGEYHMMSKLCHRDAHITWWDKLRFKWITGYEYEEE